MLRSAVGLAFVFAAPLALRAQTTDVALGIEALARRDVRGAEAAFARASTGPNELLRSTGYQWRGHVAWKVRGDTVAAVRYLSQALATARDSSMVMLEIARLSGARNRYREAVRTAFEAMQRSGDAERRGLVARMLVELAVDGSFAAPRAAIRDSVDPGILAVVRDTLLARVGRFPGRTVDAKALMDVAALLSDTTALRIGRASYFALNGAIREIHPRIAADIPAAEYATGHFLNNDVLLVLGSQFETAAILFRAERTPGLPMSAWKTNTMAYAEFIRRLRRDGAQHYRDALSGRARPGDLNRAIVKEGRRLWNSLAGTEVRDLASGAPDTAFYPAALYDVLDHYFGARIGVERSGAFEELHFAHVLHHERDPRANAPLEVLDGEVADGIDGWLLEGAGGRAAWVTDSAIHERRTALTETPFRAWLALTDPQSMPAELFRITRDSIGDIERARHDSLGYFPGVAARMFRDGATEILRNVTRPGVSDSVREWRFTNTIFSHLRRSSIFWHEGRHIVDARGGRVGSAAADEFRAKVDQVTRAGHPKLALTAILSPNIGDASSHGQANLRVMRGLNRWIRSNGASIPGYDPGTPALLQLPLLSDDQLRAAFESMRIK